MSLSIRFATAADADTLFAFIRGLAEYERAADAVQVTPPELRAQLASPRPPFECLLAERDGVAVGFALFRRVCALAVERGCARVEWAVLDWNAPAIAFYRSLGAVALDEWTMFRLTDAPLARLASNRSTA